MRAEAATGMTERSEREFSGQLEEASSFSTLTLTLTLALTLTLTSWRRLEPFDPNPHPPAFIPNHRTFDQPEPELES